MSGDILCASEKYAVIEQCHKINQSINHTLHLTQRIKFTCFDISQNFIIFGATSGGLYIFTREPCSFLKLVPSKEGSICEISISPDEKTVALGSVKGNVSLVDHCNKDTAQVGHIYYDHQGNKITCMKWNAHSNELYVGDVTGKVSVIELSNFLSKTLFQSSSATLMQLDSSIVQIDTYLNYLIVSSLTRSYLCDIQREYFRQIGKKLRDGLYGSCFYHSKKQLQLQAEDRESRDVKRVFRILRDEESFPSNNVGSNDVRIFCIRPGFRIWEVNIDSSVAKTHQFKDFLKTEPCCILKIADKQERSRLKYLNTSPNAKFCSSSFNKNYNFGKVLILNDYFLVTYNSSAIFIFHPKTLSLLFWTNYYRNVIDIKVNHNSLYIAHSDKFEINVISVVNIEFLLTNAVLNKQYIACAQLCKFFSDDIMRIIKNDAEKLQLLSVLEDYLQKSKENELYECIFPILKLLKQNAERNKQISGGQKLKNGIFVVKNNHALSSMNDFQSEPSTSIVSNTETFASNSTEQVNENEHFRILQRQFDIKQINKNVDFPQFISLVNDIADLAKIVELFSAYEGWLKYPSENLREWCFHEYLQYISNCSKAESIINNLAVHCVAENYLIDAFIHINAFKDSICSKCNFPLPNASKNCPKFYDVGEVILTKIFKINRDRAMEIVKSVPYMWRVIIKINEEEDVNNLLPQIMQYSDCALLINFVDRFSERTWTEAIKMLGMLKKGICLNCHEKFERVLTEDTVDFSNFAVLMTKNLGSAKTVSLLLENCRYISKGQLASSFYQTIILESMQNTANIFPGDNSAVDFIQDVYSKTDSDISAQFENLLANCLNYKYDMHKCTVNKTVENKLTTVLCVHCLLPILSKEEQIELICGHVHHRVCLALIENTCKKCHI